MWKTDVLLIGCIEEILKNKIYKKWACNSLRKEKHASTNQLVVYTEVKLFDLWYVSRAILLEGKGYETRHSSLLYVCVHSFGLESVQ